MLLQAVLCYLPRCVNSGAPVVPPGECCPVCPPPGQLAITATDSRDVVLYCTIATTVTPSMNSCQTSDGRVIAHGASFPAPDGCNTWLVCILTSFLALVIIITVFVLMVPLPALKLVALVSDCRILVAY